MHHVHVLQLHIILIVNNCCVEFAAVIYHQEWHTTRMHISMITLLVYFNVHKVFLF